MRQLNTETVEVLDFNIGQIVKFSTPTNLTIKKDAHIFYD